MTGVVNSPDVGQPEVGNLVRNPKRPPPLDVNVVSRAGPMLLQISCCVDEDGPAA